VAEPRVWLIEPEVKDGLPDFKRYDKIYARFVLLRSYIACKAVEAVRLPDELARFAHRRSARRQGGPGRARGGREAALELLIAAADLAGAAA